MGNNKDVKEKERRTSKPNCDAAVAREKEKRHAKEKELAREKEKRHAKEKELAREKEKRHEKEKELAREKEKRHAKEKELAREKEKRHAKEKELAREKEKKHAKEERSLISVPKGGAMTKYDENTKYVRVEEQVVMQIGENFMFMQRTHKEKRTNHTLHIDMQFGAQFKFPCSLPTVQGSRHHHLRLKD